MRVEIPERNMVVINDGDFVITYDDGYYCVGYDSNTVLASTSTDERSDRSTVDPVRYMSGNNGLSVAQSAERALVRVMQDVWYEFSLHSIGNIEMLRDAIRGMIRIGMGRQEVYRLAGGIKKGVKEGMYAGVPLAWVFKGFVEGEIVSPEPEEAYAFQRW